MKTAVQLTNGDLYNVDYDLGELREMIRNSIDGMLILKTEAGPTMLVLINHVVCVRRFGA